MNHYLFGFLIVLITALLVSFYQYTLDPENARKTFFKTALAGTVATLGLAYVFFREPQVSTEPFSIETTVQPSTILS